MVLPTPEELEGVVSAPEQPGTPEPAPPTPDTVEPEPEAGEPVSVEPEPQPPAQAPVDTELNPAVPEELAAQVQALVDVAFADGPEKAIAQARRTDNPALIDGLHATLSELQSELELRGKIKPAA